MFIQKRRDISQQLRTATGRRLAHAIQGVAGNLGLDAVAACAAELERRCVAGADTNARLEAAASLQAALETALDSITRYAGQTPPTPKSMLPTAPPSQGDLAQIATLLRSAYTAFADFEPIRAESPMRELAGRLSDESLAPLHQALENLDSSGGARAACVLAEQLGISLED
ncbi:Hpt domain-containing protein [Rhabdochromatium marinum]|uniref:Hpt domain-containing protein n=1 Tax=Rhabdochromatium marinum TaxID=48729 RepID=UPI001F5BB819|nr:Hpt domain-containing protein [Rhabdochromatium marinum]